MRIVPFPTKSTVLNPELAWITTYSGKPFWPLSPRPENLDIEDIAHSLSMQTRWTGHCKQFFSVAQHSCYVFDFIDLTPPKKKKWYSFRTPDVSQRHPAAAKALMHDATEAYLIDIAGPIKPHLGQFKFYEDKLMDVIEERYQIKADTEINRAVKLRDNQILQIEYRHLMKNATKLFGVWGPNVDVPTIMDTYFENGIPEWSPKKAKKEFLERFVTCQLA